jgi:hypothetical protein
MRIISLDVNASTNFRKEHYKTGLIGTSDCNNYIPMYALYCHDLLLFEDKPDIKILEYGFPIQATLYNNIRQYADLNTYLRASISPIKYIFTLQGSSYEFNIIRGMLYDNNNNILLCLAVSSQYVLNNTKETLSTAPDVREYILVQSTELDNPIYKNVKKQIMSLYIDECMQAGIDIIITSRPNDLLFKNNFVQLSFKSVTGLMKHLKDEVPKSLLID